MKASAEELLKLLPGPATDKWPEGLPFTQALAPSIRKFFF